MPTLREPTLSARKAKQVQLRGRLYSRSLGRPTPTSIPTYDTGTSRFPSVEGVFSGLQLQPFIHDVNVVVHKRNVQHTFRVFCKNHQHLLVNTSLRGNQQWRGDIVVMRVGRKGENLVVNMRGGDEALADFVVDRFTQRVQQKRPFRFPRNLVFYM